MSSVYTPQLDQISLKTLEMFSRILYHTLDHLGYNDDIIRFRRESWRYHTDLFGKYRNGGEHMITAGSKGEGITSYHDSDIDLLHISNIVLCVYNVEQVPSQLPDHIIVFLADMENVPPGYTRLKLYRPSSFRNVRDPGVRDSLFESERGEYFCSSTFITARCKEQYDRNNTYNVVIHDVTGPSIPRTLGSLSFDGDGATARMDFDSVIAFTFHCPRLLQTWASRPRHHEWPSRDIIQTACSFLPQVVPVGAKGSDRQFQEWRFCFIESELTLTHSLNGTQIKLYILLKMIAKNILKPVTSEISSYIMKNVTYWLSELLPLNVFREDKLVSLVMLGLTFLRTAITRWQNLPYYMIPSRNLLSERLDDSTRRELSDVLGSLLQEGPRLFLRVDKLRRGLITASQMPNYIVKYGNMRDQIEKNHIAVLVLHTLEDGGVRVDKSIEAKLIFTTTILFVSHVLSLYPSRHGVIDKDEIEQALVSILS